VAAVGTGHRTVLGSTLANNSYLTTFSGAMTLNGDLTVTSQTAQTSGTDLGVILSGVLSGSGGLFVNGSFANNGTSLTTTGAVKVSNANNTFSGNTRIAAGTLFVGNATALKNSTVDLNASDAGTLAFGSTTTNGLTSATFGGLSGSRDLVLQSTLTTPAAVALSIGNNNTDAVYSGNLTGSGSLTKIGTGTQTLSGNNSYSGGTFLNGGLLKVNGTAGAVTVNTGGSLGGSGTVGALTLNSGGFLNPGNSPGTLNATSASLLAGSTYNWEINNAAGAAGTNWDLLNVTGALNLSTLDPSNKLNLVLKSLESSGLATTSLLNFSSGTDYTWVFAQAGSISNAAFTVGADVTDYFTITTTAFNGGAQLASYFKVEVGETTVSGSTLKTLQLMTIPEPSTGSLMAFGLGGLVFDSVTASEAELKKMGIDLSADTNLEKVLQLKNSVRKINSAGVA